MDLFTRIATKSKVFQQITGISLNEFNTLVKKIKSTWKRCILNKKIKSGRPYKLVGINNQLLCLLMYYRVYVSQLFLGIYFENADKATICRVIKRLEPLVAKVTAIKKIRKLTKKQLEELIVDCTEQPIQRPKKNQKKYYSGKKKKHTIKNELITTTKGRIVSIGKIKPGSMHDFKVRKEGEPIPKDVTLIGDSVYQGHQHIHDRSKILSRARRGHPLTKEEKAANQSLSKIRIKVEHKIREMKIFRIGNDPFRNRCHTRDIKNDMVAGVFNMKNGFA